MQPVAVEGVRIDAVSAYLPERSVANSANAAKATGIEARRVAAPGETALSMCIEAAKDAILASGSSPKDFGAVVSVSFTQRERMPCGACRAHDALGLPADAISFDVMQACAGYCQGLFTAALFARQTKRKVLLLDGDCQSAFMAADDASVSPLLSDAGTATVVSPCDGGEGPAWRFAFWTDGGKGDALTLAEGSTIRMDGFGVFRYVATDVAERLRAFAAEAAPAVCGGGDFLFVPHQANVYMVRQLAKSMGVPDGRLLVSAGKYGNPASASVPLTVAAGRPAGSAALLAGFGGGLSTAAAFLRFPDGCAFSLRNG